MSLRTISGEYSSGSGDSHCASSFLLSLEYVLEEGKARLVNFVAYVLLQATDLVSEPLLPGHTYPSVGYW